MGHFGQDKKTRSLLDSTTGTIVLMSIKSIQCLSLYWFVLGQNQLMKCFSGLSIISFIFDLLEILFSVLNHIQLWNHILFYYMVSQSTITFGIKSTLFTLCLCMKLILAHYKYIWCFILYTSYAIGYGCFFERHLRWFNRWTMSNLIHNAYNLWVTRNRIRKRFQVRKSLSLIVVKGLAKGQGEGNVLPHAGQGLAEVQELWK